MGRFLNDTDYTALVRGEIKTVLTEHNTESKLLIAENMAVAQIKNYISGRYDVEGIFMSHDPMPEPDPRNYHIIMITIDCTLYHLYSSLAPNRIPKHRAERYGDALQWLKDVGKGDINADLPTLVDENGDDVFDFRIKSAYPNEDNRW